MSVMTRNIPLYFFLVVFYVIMSALGGFGVGKDGFNWNAKVFTLPLFNSEPAAEVPEAASDAADAVAGAAESVGVDTAELIGAETGVVITWTAIIVIFGFIAQWIEVIRATYVSGTQRNDVWSLILAVIVVVLFVGVPQFQTFAFFVIVIVAFGDVLLDRIVGQAVAQRDFGGMIPGN